MLRTLVADLNVALLNKVAQLLAAVILDCQFAVLIAAIAVVAEVAQMEEPLVVTPLYVLDQMVAQEIVAMDPVTELEIAAEVQKLRAEMYAAQVVNIAVIQVQAHAAIMRKLVPMAHVLAHLVRSNVEAEMDLKHAALLLILAIA
jgi:hypothetical protein